MFSRKGVIIIEKTDINEDALMEVALEAGADDMITHDDSFRDPNFTRKLYRRSRSAGRRRLRDIVDSDVEFVPSMEAAPTDEKDLKALKKMIDTLEDNDDVQKVHHNCSVDLEEI